MADTKDESTGPRADAGASTPREELHPGTQLDQYVIRRRLGQGGMGVVYEADDQTIRRKVAIKLLRHADAGTTGLRLIDEATKQGKLNHANVVTVYTAGRYREQVFIAMEFMAGGTLADWLKRPRSLPEITRMFLAAGEGLAAAHAAGLVHRDFKPENVLLDADGDPHVSDFGLADASEGGKVQGRVAGTRGFMAPEQEKGDVAIDHRADQYAFCVSLYSALYKEMPFPKQGETPKPPRPQSTAQLLAVPLWLRRVVVKGLATNPDERYPSMKALLAELANDPARKRRQRILSVITAVSVAALLGLSAWLSTRETPEDRARSVCAERVKGQAGAVWSPDRRGKAEAAFQRELAAGAWTQVNQHLTEELKSWTQASLDACQLAQTDPKRVPFQACLEERRKTLDSMGEVFSAADRGIVTNAINTVMLEVQPATSCRPTPSKASADPVATGEDDKLRSGLAKVRVLRAAAKYVPALEEAMTVKDEAEDAQALEPLAEAQLAVGELYADQLSDGAETYLLDAILSAETIGNDELRARAWIVLLLWSADREEKVERARFAQREGNAVLFKLGRPALLDASWYTAVGQFEYAQKNLEGARTAFSRALELRRANLPPEHPLVLRSRVNWAKSLPPTDARVQPELEDVRAARARLFGPRHAETVDAVLALARTHMQLHACDKARALYDDALSFSLDRVEENPLDAGGIDAELAQALDCLGLPLDARAVACDALKYLHKGGASAAEIQRVETLLRALDKKVINPGAWSCEAAAR